MKHLILVLLCSVGLWAQAPVQSTSTSHSAATSARAQERITREVRHELVMLPHYSLFDNLQYQVNGDTVVLMGQVTKPVIKSEAEKQVKKIEGVEKVENRIEVLPPSPTDDRIRLEAARRIFSADGLYRYSLAAVPSIHIIVRGGRITLDGVVDNETDRNIAAMQARQVPGAFGVTNNLRVEGQTDTAQSQR
jgi:hyperosmotically inducible protein